VEIDMPRNKISKKEKVWKHLIANPLATSKEVASKVGCTPNYVHHLKSTIGTPREVFEAEAKAKAKNATSMFTTFDEAISRAPIRDLSVGTTWKSRVVQLLITLAIMVVLISWLYVAWL